MPTARELKMEIPLYRSIPMKPVSQKHCEKRFAWSFFAANFARPVVMALASIVTIIFIAGLATNVFAQGTWTEKAPLSTARWGVGSEVVNGIVYVLGGNNNTTLLLTNEAYDPSTNTWTTKAPIPG